MNEWLLSDTELRALEAKYNAMPLSAYLHTPTKEHRLVAQAQLRKVIEIISRRSDECSAKAWNELKKEAGLENG